MLTIGTLLLVSHTTGSLAVAGLVSGAGAIGTAVGGPTQGSLADRFGQRPVLLVVVPVQALALVGLVAGATAGLPTAALVALSALTGALAPQVGPLARGRWLGLTDDAPRVRAASMSYESTADEISFVAGPALVGIVSAALSPQVALVGAACVSLVFGLAFALHPTASPARTVEPAAATRSGTATTGSPSRATPSGTDGHGFLGLLLRVAAPVTGMLGMGMLFGGTQTAVSAFVRDAGSPDQAGVVYATMALSSAVTALCVILLPARWTLRSRWIAFSAGLLLTTSGMLVTVLAGAGTAGLVVAMLATGLFVGPIMVTIFSVGGEAAPVARSGATMTALASASVVGIAIGSSVGGALAESAGTVPAFAVPVAAALVLLVAGVSSTSHRDPWAEPVPR
ncbi:MFS transporter [Paraoerskovia sediminicola]|uniref:MFS transporter n=1 Tax=Paraoerskovia sediminicola TaxID=1138587 RepID=A0ABN6XED7_9CELL|nr:MFS transporter [Paraoerskovia sediminicola]BDZ43288.1 MFS transporter [Paraoerskovia sediminicola]